MLIDSPQTYNAHQSNNDNRNITENTERHLNAKKIWSGIHRGRRREAKRMARHVEFLDKVSDEPEEGDATIFQKPYDKKNDHNNNSRRSFHSSHYVQDRSQGRSNHTVTSNDAKDQESNSQEGNRTNSKN